MHLVVVGIARTLADRGDDSLAWVLADAEAGELFAFGNSEAGNDLVMWDALTTADGSKPPFPVTRSRAPRSSPRSPPRGRASSCSASRRTARTVRGSCTASSPATTPGVTTLDDWDTLGMRATQSRSTVLEDAVVPDDRIVRFLPVGPNADPFVFAPVRELPAAHRLRLRRDRGSRARARRRGGAPAHQPQERRRQLRGRSRHPLAARRRGARPRRARPAARDPRLRRRRARRPRRALVPRAHRA